jgi:hypothetical protein
MEKLHINYTPLVASPIIRSLLKSYISNIKESELRAQRIINVFNAQVEKNTLDNIKSKLINGSRR